MFVALEVAGVGDLLSTNSHILEGHVSDLGTLRSPKNVRLTKNTGRGDFDVLKENSGQVA